MAAAIGCAAAVGVTVFVFRSWILEAWFIHRLDATNPEARMQAADALGDLGSARAVPRLLEVLTEEASATDNLLSREKEEAPRSVGRQCMFALVKMGRKTVVRPLLELSSADPIHRFWSVKAVQRIGAAAVTAVPALLRAIEDEQEMMETRTAAAEALADLGSSHEAALPAILARAKDPAAPAEIRARLVTVVGDAGQRIKKLQENGFPVPDPNRPAGELSLEERTDRLKDLAVAGLLELSSDDSPLIRVEALQWLGILLAGVKGPLRERCHQTVAVAMQDSDPGVRGMALQAYLSGGTNGEPDPRPLLAHLDDPDDFIRGFCAYRLVSQRNWSVPLESFHRLLGDSSENVRHLARDHLEQRGSTAIPWALKLLRDPRPRAREEAAKLLEKIGAGHDDVLLALRKVISGDDERASRAAVEALGKLDSHIESTLGEITLLLDDERPHVREGAARLIARCGKAAQRAAPQLGRLIDASNAGVRQAGLEAILSAGAVNLPALVPKLLVALADPESPEVRGAAASALGGLSACSAEVVHALRKACEDPIRDVRIAAYVAIGELGPAALGAREEIAEALERSVSWGEEQKAAVWALVSLYKDEAECQKRVLAFLRQRPREQEASADVGRALWHFWREPVARVTACLDDPEPLNREVAARILHGWGYQSESALPRLRALSKDPDADVRAEAAAAVGWIESRLR